VRWGVRFTARERAGLPYALNQAGFVAGLVLLVALAWITDWTIRLIVVNAKLSGRTSYIDIMDHCFGPSGRAAVSFFQFAFAFGGGSLYYLAHELADHLAGMCAFGIIIGDPSAYSTLACADYAQATRSRK
jgi:sodium-coupled neutral amino acid transporter 11